MGFRMRRAFTVIPGLRVTVSPRGIGISGGVPGARVAVNSSGRVTGTLSVPGSGISHVSSYPLFQAPPAAAQAASGPEVMDLAPSPVRTKPGLVAPFWEKDLYRALVQGDYGEFEVIAEQDRDARQTCMFLDVMLRCAVTGDSERARVVLEQLWVEGYTATGDPFMRKYFPGALLAVRIADFFDFELPGDRDGIGMLLAELLQREEKVEQAALLIEGLTPTSPTAIFLAELYARLRRWAEIVELTNGVANVDDLTTYLLIQRGAAFRAQGYFDAARESFKAAYAPRSRAQALRHRALIERGMTYLVEGKRAPARRDFEKVLAEDAHYPGLSDYLMSLDE